MRRVILHASSTVHPLTIINQSYVATGHGILHGGPRLTQKIVSSRTPWSRQHFSLGWGRTTVSRTDGLVSCQEGSPDIISSLAMLPYYNPFPVTGRTYHTFRTKGAGQKATTNTVRNLEWIISRIIVNYRSCQLFIVLIAGFRSCLYFTR